MEKYSVTNQNTIESFRGLAECGYGDDTIYDQEGNLWIVFRSQGNESPNTYNVKVEGSKYTDVVVCIG